MGRIIISIENDEGKIIGKKTYDLNKVQTMSEIEAEVEKLRKSLLPDISKELFEEAQSEYKKKSQRLKRKL